LLLSSRKVLIFTQGSFNQFTSPGLQVLVLVLGPQVTVAGGGIWLRQSSLRHILASPGYAPGTIAVNVIWIERGFNACQTHCSIYPPIFNSFPVIQPVSSNVCLPFFSHFGDKCHTVGKKFNACKTPCCIYPSIFNHF